MPCFCWMFRCRSSRGFLTTLASRRLKLFFSFCCSCSPHCLLLALRTLRSIAYIYFFPLVLVFYLLVIVFRLLRAINRWFTTDQNLSAQQTDSAQIEVVAPQTEEIALVAAVASDAGPKVSSVLLRPFKRYTVLWCILLLIATHTVIIWLSFIVVLCHLVWKIIGVLKITLFSRSWIEKIGRQVFINLDTMLRTLHAVNARTHGNEELKNLWRQLGLWRNVAGFLQNKYLVSRSAAARHDVFPVCVRLHSVAVFVRVLRDREGKWIELPVA